MTRRRTLCSLIVATALMTAAAVAADEPYRESFEATYPLDPGGLVSLSNINGDVSFDVWDRGEVKVSAVKEASSRERLDALEIEVETDGGAVRIDTRYPSSRDLGRMLRHGHSAVEYTVTVPRGSRLEDVELVNGHATVHGVAGGVEIECVNGDIRAGDLAGLVRLQVVNGSIELEYAGADPGDEVRLESVNGPIELVLAGGAGADIEAETVNGTLRSDLGLEVRKGKYVGATMRGSVGGGGTRVLLESVNGAITVR